jgi:hypothetical protein
MFFRVNPRKKIRITKRRKRRMKLSFFGVDEFKYVGLRILILRNNCIDEAIRSFFVLGGLSDRLLCDDFLDPTVEVTCESHARAVDLSQNVFVLLFLVPVQNEVGSPNERDFSFFEGLLDQGQSFKEESHQSLPILGVIVTILGSREKGGREGISSLSRFFVNDEDRMSSNHKDSDFSFFDAGEEPHIDQHAILSDNVFLTELHEFTESCEFNVVVNGLSALDLGIKREDISSLVWALINIDNSPDSLTCRATVLLENTFSEGKSLREVLLEVSHIVVDIGVFGDEAGFVELDEGVLGAKVDHGVGTCHTDESFLREFSKVFEENFFVVRERARIDSAHVGAEILLDELADLVSLFIFKFDNLSVPAQLFDLFDDGDSILTESIRALVTSTD